MTKERYEWLAKQIFLAALEVHKELGPGLLESVYQYAFCKELSIRSIAFQQQVAVPLYYKGSNTGKEFYIDLLVEDELIIELKAVDEIHPVHEAQLLSYLKLANKKMGFLINFNTVLLKDGFRRRVNNY
ncbi:MAG: GxxExxY protein [Chitinophagales bacterium]|nr:GxxExxY protein [Chitinophagales bacterium]